MGSNQHLIEINGKKFDVSTGKPVVPASPASAQPKSGTVVDGFFKPATPHVIKPKPVVAKSTPQTTHQSHHKPVNRPEHQHAPHHKPEKSQTLMRNAVKKPAPKTQPANHTTPQVTVNPARLERAKKVHKSALISRFPSQSNHSAFVKKTEPVAVKEAPIHKAAPVHPPSTTHAHVTSKSEQLFNNALSNATSHEALSKHHTKKPRNKHIARKLHASRRIVQIAAGTLAVIILAGFITYQNLPNLNLRLASTKAGFSATMPGYKPDGFGVGSNIEHSPGKVTINFASNTDNRNYHITQRVSSWNSETLQENFLNAENKAFQTLQEKGKTIYLYDGSNATWVNGGVWYQIEGNSQLSNDQLLRIVNSM